MFNKFFKKQETPMAPAATPAPATEKVFGPTKKKKNTYTITYEVFMTAGMFEWCPNTPLPVLKVNGAEIPDAKGGYITCHQFPNPGASSIEVLGHSAPEWRIIMGDKIATTIIEYLDKTSGTPALIVYPDGRVQSMIANEDINQVIETRLNHASRRDLVHQYNRIAELVKIAKPLIEQRYAEMEKAPRKDHEARAKFIAELNRRQIEQAQKIVAARQK